jgi:hypothetical protein
MTNKKVRFSVRIILAMTLAVAILAPAPPGTNAYVPSPTVEGPIPYSVGTHGFPFTTVPDPAELEAMGYTEQEFFFSGAVPSASGPLPYKSRLLVRFPINPKRFNGTVVVEWLNVTVGSDISHDWNLTRRQIMRDGYAYVGVSAQPLGICGIKAWDPVRYGELTHPALPPGPCPPLAPDPYSYDIFSQAGKAVRDNPLILNGLEVKQLLAVGASGSALRLIIHVNTYNPTAQIYDGYLLHVIGMGGGGLITDVNTKVLILNSENEVLGYYPFRGLQPANVRYWEVAGVGHTAEWLYVKAQFERAGLHPVFNCDYPQSDEFIPLYPVGDAALDALNWWVSGGEAPPDSPLVEVIPGTPNRIARDQYGNALGGIRLPQIEVPIGRFTGTNSPTVNQNCRLAGGFDLFDGQPAGITPNDVWDEPTLDQLYPNHGSYVSAFVHAVNNIVRAGFMLKPDAKIAKEEAARSNISK